MPQEYSIQSIRCGRVVGCETEEEYRHAVAQCVDAGQAVADYGVAHTGMGHAPSAGFVRVVPPADVFEHWKADMGVRVSGGMTLGRLQEQLAEAHQWLPLDADDDVTVAEAIAHNVYGPLRLAHGTCRDLLLGLRYVDGHGQWVKVGGKTVKNVAGYDVTRLMVGSMNTLGLIADANLRTAAIPHQITSLRVTGLDVQRLDETMSDLLTCDASPGSIEHTATGDRQTVCHVAYAGIPKGCDAQVDAFKKWLVARGMKTGQVDRVDTDYAADAIERAQRRAWRRSATACVKLVVPPAATGRTMTALLHDTLAFTHLDAMPAHGVIHIGAAWTVEQARQADARINQLIGQSGGLRVWIKRPGDTPQVVPFAPPQDDWAMLAKIKAALDPKNIFNPGRFL